MINAAYWRVYDVKQILIYLVISVWSEQEAETAMKMH